MDNNYYKYKKYKNKYLMHTGGMNQEVQNVINPNISDNNIIIEIGKHNLYNYMNNCISNTILHN